jgi:hypothetical protein
MLDLDTQDGLRTVSSPKFGRTPLGVDVSTDPSDDPWQRLDIF